MISTLEVHYLSRRSALTAGKTEGRTLTLFAPTSQSVSGGTNVELRISFADTERTFRIHGVAISGTSAMGRDGQGGLMVGFLGDNKRRAAEMIAFCAQRPESMGTALRERFPVRKRCKVVFSNRQLQGTMLDLSQSGAFIAGDGFAKLEPGAVAKLKLGGGLFGMGGTWVEARVIWQGRKGSQAGCGVRFTGQEARQSSAIQRLLETAISR